MESVSTPATALRRHADLPFLDVGDPGYVQAPGSYLQGRAVDDWILATDRGFKVVGYEPSQAVLRDRRFGKDHLALVESIGITSGAVHAFHKRMIINREEDHARLRAPLARYFAPRSIGRVRQVARQIVDDCLDVVAGHDETADLYATVCRRVPAAMYCHLVAAPRPDEEFVTRISDTVLLMFRRDPAYRDQILAAYEELFAYVEEQVELKRRRPGDDLLSLLLRAGQDGVLTAQEASDHATALLEASTDNTAAQMGLVLGSILEDEQVWGRLVAEPSLIPGAVDEAIRLVPRMGIIERTARQDIEIAGVLIPAGSVVGVSVYAAQRDRRKFVNPDDFMIQRPDAATPLTFGGGAYSCLGQSLARIEIEELIHSLVRRFPDIGLLEEFHPRMGRFITDAPRLRVRSAAQERRNSCACQAT